MNKINIDKVKAISKKIRLNNEIVKDNYNFLKFTILSDTDGILHFGRYKGKRLKEVYFENPTYLRFMLSENFDKKIKEIIKNILVRNNDYDNIEDIMKTTDKDVASRSLAKYKENSYFDDNMEGEFL